MNNNNSSHKAKMNENNNVIYSNDEKGEIIKIYVKTGNNKTFPLTVPSTSTITDVIALIKDREKIEGAELFYYSELLDEKKTLQHYNLQNDCIITYKEISNVKMKEEKEKIEVYIKAKLFQFALTLSPSLSLRRLKLKIEKRKGINEYQQRLSHHFTELIDETKTLSQLQIQNYSTIYLSIQYIDDGFPRLLSFLLSNDLLLSSPSPSPLYIPHIINDKLDELNKEEEEIKESIIHLVCCKPLNKLPNELQYLTNLQSITANGCHLSSISPFIHCLSSSLTSLHLSSNSLFYLPSEMQLLSQLKELNVSHNHLSDIPSFLSFIPSLSLLNLSHNEITLIPIAIKSLSHLTHLNLANNQITTIPGDLFNHLTSLRYLSFHHNLLHHFPAFDFGKLKEMIDLDLTDNQIYDIPLGISSFSNLSQLFELNFNRNQINIISPDIKQLTHLLKLHLNQNELTFIPPEISFLSHLNEINIDDNKLLYIPVEIGALRNLKKLSLRNNKISSIPAELCNLSSLIQLNLEENKILSLPGDIGRLKQLQILKLDHNLLILLPPQFSLLTSLRTLYLGDNLFEEKLTRSHPLFKHFSSLDYFYS